MEEHNDKTTFTAFIGYVGTAESYPVREQALLYPFKTIIFK
jgi:hypothetical protein